MTERQEGFVGPDPLIREKLVRDGILEERGSRGEENGFDIILRYEKLWKNLKRRPSMIEVALQGDVHPRVYLRSFGSWYAMHQEMEKRLGYRVIQESERRLYAEAGEFLAEIERTPMSLSYKMVVLSAWLNRDKGLLRPFALREIAISFREFFLDPFRRVDLEKTRIFNLDNVTNRMLESYLLGTRNVIRSLAGLDKREMSQSFFQYSPNSQELVYVGKGASLDGFSEALRERVIYRLFVYYQRVLAKKMECDRTFNHVKR